MARELISKNLWDFPSLTLSSLLDDDNDLLSFPLAPRTNEGLSISEDDTHVFVEAALPGISTDDIDITFDQGILRISGQSHQEDNDGKRYYRRAASSFSYRVAVPGEIDQSAEPEATYADGILKLAFTKAAQVQPKKITVKSKDQLQAGDKKDG